MASLEASGISANLRNLDEVAAPPPEGSQETKKQRLWLGYSADNLGNPDRSHIDIVHPEPETYTGEQYDVPNDYRNLNELADPEPINSEQAQRTQHLEDRSNLPHRIPHKDQLGQRRVSRLATELYTISYLILFSILGTLARLGLQALTIYPGAPVQTGLLWANVGGCLILGFLSEDRKLFQEEWGDGREAKRHNAQSVEDFRELQEVSAPAAKKHNAVKKTIPLYIGLATGFCGSFTSFSSFLRDTFYALANALPVPINHPSAAPISETMNVHRNPGYSFLATLAVLIITIGLCLSALQFGAHLALGLAPYTPSIPFRFARKIVDRSVVFLAGGCWLGAVVMAVFPPDRFGGPVTQQPSSAPEMWRTKALFALVFAPLGCLLRFYASLSLNGRIRAFPLGTFAVNVLGSALQAMFIDLQRAPIGGLVGCQVLQGMEDGFCGCLTTVSTWISELKGLRLQHAYFYGGMSVGVGVSFMIIIMGSLLWTQGFVDPLCTICIGC